MAEEKKGAFLDSLNRNAKQIRADRAASIGEDAQLLYKRKVEDLQVLVSKLKREQNNKLDMSPNSAMSLILASGFDADEFANEDINLGVQIRNAEIKLDIAKKRYIFLFGVS